MSEQVEVSSIPKCDFCNELHRDVDATIDGKTKFGSWAYMCDNHWRLNGIGKLGTGFGQRLILREGGKS